MKKLYTLIAAVAVASFGASAAELQLSPVKATPETFTNINRLDKKVAAETNGTISDFKKAPAKKQSAAPVDGWEVVGTGTYFDDLIAANFGVIGEGFAWDVTIEQNSKEKGWYRFIPYNENSPIAALMQLADNTYLYINATDPDKVYTEDFFAYESYPFINRVPESEIGSNFITEARPAGYGTFIDGKITFPAASHVFYEAGDTEEESGFYYSNFWGRLASTTYKAYKDLGKTKFFDGVFGSMYNAYNGVAGEIEIDLLQDIKNPGVFRMNNYLANGFYVEVDATDPEYVIIPEASIGYEDKDDGETIILSQSYALAYLTKEKYDKAKFISAYPQYNITRTGNVINMPGNSVFFWWPYTDGKSGTKADAFYSAQNPIASKLIIPEGTNEGGVNDIVVAEDENAPVEYFNLQGIRVANPENGLYIRRQGKSVSKIYVK